MCILLMTRFFHACSTFQYILQKLLLWARVLTMVRDKHTGLASVFPKEFLCPGVCGTFTKNWKLIFQDFKSWKLVWFQIMETCFKSWKLVWSKSWKFFKSWKISNHGNLSGPNHGNLSGWAKQGVLLLNYVMTVEDGKANSHKGKGGEHFTDAIIFWLNHNLEGVVFLLWGEDAQKKGASIDEKNTLL